MSALNLTSAGQFAGVTVIAADAGLVEMVLTQLVINSRYILMSLALGMDRGGKLTAEFFVGVGTVAALGWISGTTIGAAAGSILPASIRSALGIMLYGMFAAIVLPQARQERSLGVLHDPVSCAELPFHMAAGTEGSVRGTCYRDLYHGSGGTLRGVLPGAGRGGRGMSVYIYIIVMAVTTYLIRALPLTLFKKQIRNRFVRSFLHYIPVACLTSMTFPAILYATEHIVSGAVGLAVAVILALKNKSLITVAGTSCAAVFLVEQVMALL